MFSTADLQHLRCQEHSGTKNVTSEVTVTVAKAAVLAVPRPDVCQPGIELALLLLASC